MEPTSFTVKEDSQFKGGDTEFVKTKLMTRLTYTLDEVSKALFCRTEVLWGQGFGKTWVLLLSRSGLGCLGGGEVVLRTQLRPAQG
jgi:hypothetical protein